MIRRPSTNTGPVTRQPVARSLRVMTVALVLGLLFAPVPALAQTGGGDRTAAGTAVTARLSHRPLTLLTGDNTSRFAVRPATISFGASANEIIGGPGVSQSQFEAADLGHISWSRWTPASARGRGLMWSNDCSPNCPEGTYHSSPVTIKTGDGFSGHYQRLSYVYRNEGHRLHIHSTLRRTPGTDVWSWW